MPDRRNSGGSRFVGHQRSDRYAIKESEMQIGMRSLSRRAQWTVAAAIAAVLFAAWAAGTPPQAPQSSPPVATSSTLAVGIPTQTFNFVASTQRNTNWCWAASIQMTLNYYGVAITQEEIVARTYGTDPYGNLPDFTASVQSVTANLNMSSVDDRGRPYTVSASVASGAPPPAQLLQELSAGRPVVVAYANSSTPGHAVIVTGATYVQTTQGPIVQSIIVRDPWPSEENLARGGRVEYSADQFAANMQAYWFVRVQ
jgi:hypothetical protein